MIVKRVFWGDQVYLDAYLADRIEGFTRKAILIIPGGGYGGVCSDREGEPVALAFLSHGFNAFVLHYSHAGNSNKTFPAQLIEASIAMIHIKDHADMYNVDPEQVFVAGFSAGGHLAGCLGTMWHKQEVCSLIDMRYGRNRPAGMMLIYPVVTASEPYWNSGSIQNLLGTREPTEEQLLECSLEKHVDARSCPAFIVHTSNDQTVDVRNALALANAYAVAGQQFELHVYPDAPHGVALGNRITKCGVEKWENPQIAKWVENAVAWSEGIIG